MAPRVVVRTICMVAIALLGTRAWAVNSIEVTSLRAARGQSGVEVRVKLINDITTRNITIPLAIRTVSGTAFITSLQLGFGDRLPPDAGSPLSEIQVVNQYDAEVGACKSNQPGGFGSLTSIDTLSHPVTGSPVGLMFSRANLFSPTLIPGSDVIGSLRLTVDISSGQGRFEIDSTCTNPANHVSFIEVGTNIAYAPAFTAGTVDVGYAPVARDTSWSTPEDAAKTVSYLPAADDDADPLTFTIVSGPFNGAIGGFNASTGGFIYTPADQYSGLDSLRFAVTDGIDTDSGTVRITVTLVNDPPVARDTTVMVDEDSQVSSNFPASDIDSPTLTYAYLANPSHGSITAFDAATGAYTYQPSPNYHGSDQIDFRATDGGGAFDNGTVTVIVNSINDPPVARDTTLDVPFEFAVEGRFHSYDIDGGAPYYSKVDGPAHGTFTGFTASTGTFTYTPAGGYFGPDSIRFTAFDGTDNSNLGVVRITVDSVACFCPWHMDYDRNGQTNALELTRLIDAVFFGGQPYPAVAPCPVSDMDFNCDCYLDAIDIAKVIDIVFFGSVDFCEPCAAQCQ